MMIDIRSDTVTRPTPAMREAMARAEVGDDGLGEDPTVIALEEEVARITGKEAALFVPSGTMGNQLAIATQTRPGDDVIVGEGAHLVHFEAGAGAAMNGVQFTIAGRGGFFSPDDIDAVAEPPVEWTPRPTLVAIENTHNRSGGRAWPHALARSVAERARAYSLAAHLDGARIWNASVALGVDVATLCSPFDTASVCFSKGLGAPVGSAFCASRELTRKARLFRKRWGGGMRQAGIVAAGALFALAHHRERLADDHANARAFAERMAQVDGARVDLDSVQTNIVNVDVAVDSFAVAEEARSLGVLIAAVAPRRLRAVTHLQVSRAEAIAAAEVLGQAIARVVAKAGVVQPPDAGPFRARA
jgi:threonine aldolase